MCRVAGWLGGGGSGLRSWRTPSADSRKETASAAMVVVAPVRPISRPPAGGPRACDSQVVVSNRLLASISSADGTSDFRCAPLAALNAITATVCTTPARHSWQKLSTPSAAAAGTLPSAVKRARSAAIITGRLRRYSMPTPNGSAMIALAAPDRAIRTDTWSAEARSTSTATMGKAPAPIPLPAALTEKAAHNHRKSRLNGCPRTRRCYARTPCRARRRAAVRMRPSQ